MRRNNKLVLTLILASIGGAMVSVQTKSRLGTENVALAFEYVGDSDKPVTPVIISDSREGAEWCRTSILKRDKFEFTDLHVVDSSLLSRLLEETTLYGRQHKANTGEEKTISIIAINGQSKDQFLLTGRAGITLIDNLKKQIQTNEALNADLSHFQLRVRYLIKTNKLAGGWRILSPSLFPEQWQRRIPAYDITLALTRATVGWPTLAGSARVGSSRFFFFLMPHNLKRIIGRGDLHFITFTCYQRRKFLASFLSKNVATQILGEVRSRFNFLLVGYVFMPDHVHLLISEPPGSTPAKAMQVFKQRVSRKLRARKTRRTSQLSFVFPEEHDLPRRFWQRRYFDMNIYTRYKFRQKLDYIHANPVKERLVSHPKDWPWSSWSAYVGKPALLPIDFLS